jgi:hypothetical protein
MRERNQIRGILGIPVRSTGLWVRTLVSETKEAINWAHLCLGELVAQKYISTVLTTNFDQLVLSGMVRAGVLPVMCDGIESLKRISGMPRHPQLVELHGSRHAYVLRNRPEDVAAIRKDPQVSAAIRSLLQCNDLCRRRLWWP